MVDVAVVGAGLSGLICAKQLQKVGYEVAIVEKSRGLGGRLATRRIAGTWADHGVRYLELQGFLTQQLLDIMGDRAILHAWDIPVSQVNSDDVIPLPTGRYVADQGLTAVAKALAEGLNIHRGQRVVAIAPHVDGWMLTCETVASTPDEPLTHLTAKALVLMIPAPQALDLTQPLVAEHPSLLQVVQSLQSVEFDPCITAIAAYAPGTLDPNPTMQACHFTSHPTLAWVSVDARKQSRFSTADAIAVVVQSNATFAEQHLDDGDLVPVGQSLLEAAAPCLSESLVQPEIVQVHRWRYAFCRTPYPTPYVQSVEPGLLLCGGDWCGGSQVEDALGSGLQTAIALDRRMEHRMDEQLEAGNSRMDLRALFCLT
ncbi:MAG: FAD-dependent oxidoreductase [Synechococcales cyanobacterium T60_A2020_003]|nr:FAD-dependent oxidoreductase [Synechococcales cyanobacterium T60_A2020_003]